MTPVDLVVVDESGNELTTFRGVLAVARAERRDAMPSDVPAASHILTAPQDTYGLAPTARFAHGDIIYRVLGRKTMSADLQPGVDRWRVVEEIDIAL